MNEPDKIPSNEITPASVYFNRRTFMRAGVMAGSVAATAIVYRAFNRVPLRSRAGGGQPAEETQVLEPMDPAIASGFRVADEKTTLEQVTHYNNFYEFSTDKEEVAAAAAKFSTKGWKVSVGGLVSKPKEFDLDDLLKISPPEERVYRMRCVEGWSMVIPWVGYSVSKLLEEVEPLSSAKYVAFETLLDPQRMPGQKDNVLKWPYVEGLRLDEAMNPLAILASGLYGKSMPPQDGAPIRLVTPWKYGFKGIKSIVKITLVAEMPPTSWNIYAPNEYGFYANVNPEVDHPRWSQATERRISAKGITEQPTLMFNGYGAQVAKLYRGMDLAKNF